MKEWKSLVAASLLGTERQAPQLPPGEGDLGTLLRGLDAGDPPRLVLSAAVAISLYRRSGWLPPPDNASAPAAAAPETAPACSPAAAGRLGQMLQGVHREVLPEWLDLVARAGQRVPAEYLPALLNLGSTPAGREVRPAIIEVLGNRGRWLAAQNPAWDYSAEPETDEDWETGTTGARVNVLRRRRRHDPDAARAMLEGTWATETPEDRARLLLVLATGLTPTDEPFLETALDDRRKEVRTVATDLLARLPGSALGRRMIERAAPLLAVQRGLLGRTSLTVRLPEACDKAMQRDGIEPKPPSHLPKALGEKAWWLLQILGATPIGFWAAHLGVEPRQLTELARKSEWSEPLLEGWAQAAARACSGGAPEAGVAWAEAILEARPRVDAVGVEIVRALPPDRREAVILRLLRTQGKLQGEHPALFALSAHRDPWSETLSMTVVEAVRDRLRDAASAYDWTLRSLLKDYALRIPPALLPRIEAAWPQDSANPSAAEFLSILQFRHDMLQEISP